MPQATSDAPQPLPRRARRSLARCSVAVVWLMFAALATAEHGHAREAGRSERARVVVSSLRVRLSSVLPGCEGRACDADLGQAPALGASRLISARELREAIESAGEDAARFEPLQAVRVESLARTLSPAELEDLARPLIARCLPAGVRLVRVEAKVPAVIPGRATLGDCTLPALRKRAGPGGSTALVDVVQEGVTVKRLPLFVRYEMSERAARPDIARGQVLTLVIERRTATVSTQGVALTDSDIGDVAAFRVSRTGRVVQARLRKDGVAVVVEGQP